MIYLKTIYFFEVTAFSCICNILNIIQTPWTHVRVAVVTALTVITLVSVTPPVCVTMIVVLTMLNSVQVRKDL